MTRLEVRRFTADDLSEAGALLARRHARDRSRLVVAGGSTDPVACAEAVIPVANDTRSIGFIAHRGGKPAGFLIGEALLLSPEDFASQFLPPHSGSIGIESHAVADGEDQSEVYRALYTELAYEWVRAGFFVHRWGIPAGDPDLNEAVASLGFGRHSVAATRLVADPVTAPGDSSIEIHRAGSEDIAVVQSLADHLMAFHSRSPMFWPFLRSTDAAARAYNQRELESQSTPYWVAYANGQAVAMQTFLKPGFVPPIVDPEGSIYLFDGVVHESARGGGIGSRLLRHSMAWAAENGYRTCTLHFASANPSGGPFWLANGFRPIEYTMERRIDERVAWANG